MSKTETAQDTGMEGVIGWPAKSYAAMLGLEQRVPAHSADGKTAPARIYLAKADIDQATGGIVHLETQASADKRTGAILSLDMKFTNQQLTGNRTTQHVFQIENTINKNGDIVPDSIYCMGVRVYSAAQDGADFNVQALNNIFQAVQEINNTMRPPYAGDQNEYSPKNVLRILLRNHIQDVIGEDLAIKFEGIDEKGRFDFEYRDVFNKLASNDNRRITFPSRDFAMAAAGDRSVNTLDYSNAEKGLVAPKFATHTPSGVMYKAEQIRKNLKTKLNYQSALSPVGPSIAGINAQSLPSVVALEFRSAHTGARAQDEQYLKTVDLYGTPIKGSDPLEQMRALRLQNRINNDIADGRYPQFMTHSIEADVHDYAYDIVPPDKGQTRIDIIRKQGNDNMKRIAGMGDQLGDNTTYIHTKTDKDGVVHKQGIMVDLGMSFAPKNSEYSAGVPDITKDLEHFDDFFLTHHHADHLGGVPIYTDAGLFASPEHYERAGKGEYRGKTFHASDKQILRAKYDLQRKGIDKEKWPKFNELKGDGWVHIRNKKTGELCFSVGFSAETIPHTARTNGFKIIAYNGNKMEFAHMKLGDMRYGRHLLEGHNSPIPAAEVLDSGWLAKGPEEILEVQARMLEGGEITVEEMVDPASVTGRRFIAEIDGTNYKKPGFARTELDAEENEVLIKNRLHKDKAVMVSMMSTSDAGFERELRVAVRTDSHVSLVGANLENAGIIMNKTGVNAELVDVDGTKEVQSYLDWAYEKLHSIDYDNFPHNLDEIYCEYKDCKKPEKREEYIERIIEANKDKPEQLRGILFYVLQQNKASNHRYAAQMMFEAKTKELLGEKMMLGSIYVGRDAQTYKNMFKDDKGRVRTGLTGTQGTENEEEAATPKHFAGRGIYNANHKNRKAAVPLKADDYFWMFAQGAIPGNEPERHAMEKRGADLGFPIYSAYGEGFKVYNADDEEALRTLIQEQKGFAERDMEGNLIVSDMPIYPSGHGHKEDAKAFLEVIKPDMATINHTDDIETINEFITEMREWGINTPGEQIKNFHYFTFVHGETNGDGVKCLTLGRTLPSMILATEIREWNKQYGGTTTAQRIVSLDGEGGVVSDGLTAGEDIDPENGKTIFTYFGSLSRQEEDENSERRKPAQRRSEADIEEPQEDKRYKGPTMPKRCNNNDDESFDAFMEGLGL